MLCTGIAGILGLTNHKSAASSSSAAATAVAANPLQRSRPVSIQTQSLALRALRKQKPHVLASSQSWLPLLRPSIPVGWRLRLLREIFTQQTQEPANMLGRSSGNHDWLRFLRFSFTQRTQHKRLRLNGNRALRLHKGINIKLA